MAIVRGSDDPDGSGRLEGFAVLGTGSPSSVRDEDGNIVPVNTVGIYGAVGDAGSVNEVIVDITTALDQKVTAGVAGAFVPKPPEGVGSAPDAFGFLGGNDLRFNQPTGVYGESSHEGVVGISKGPVGLGVLGMADQSGSNFDPATGGSGVLGSGYIGVRGETQTGVAVLGRIFGGPNALAGLFVGNVRVQGDMEATGAITVDGDVFLKNRGDVAEQFGVVSECAPGSVMVIGENTLLEPCSQDYDTRAVGVISGAGSLRPAITLGRSEAETPTVSIAMVGTTFCQVDADRAAIEAGDLLTSSSTLGHAMKALDPFRSFGAVIGKALAPLSHGHGLIPIVVALQ
jgi:hypothetical protein